ncbi:MAG TPA: 2'-5' RNA ligase family protein [Chitinophagaceae bacterium]|jgi:2'-5' RNA ligase|nr:2'-5' RNA ligase family protein [Chitinophagaceae bacterium]
MMSKMPGYSLNEYRLIMPLSEALQEQVKVVREKLHKDHRVKLPFELQPSLTILRFHAFDKMEAKLLERLHQVALCTQPFKIELQDFSAYPSHTIYIEVLTKSSFNDLCKNLKKHRWLMNIPGHLPQFINEPHLIIAQRLKPKQFENMWCQCEHSQFTGRFIADSMLLLKRSETNKMYHSVRKLEFMNLPMNISQGELFGS